MDRLTQQGMQVLSSLATLTHLSVGSAPYLPACLSRLTGLRELYLEDVAEDMPQGEASTLLNGALPHLVQVGGLGGWGAGGRWVARPVVLLAHDPLVHRMGLPPKAAVRCVLWLAIMCLHPLCLPSGHQPQSPTCGNLVFAEHWAPLLRPPPP